MSTTILEKEQTTTSAAQDKKRPGYSSSASWGPARPAIKPAAAEEKNYPSCLDIAAEFVARG